jgi:hypothetical protein
MSQINTNCKQYNEICEPQILKFDAVWQGNWELFSSLLTIDSC